MTFKNKNLNSKAGKPDFPLLDWRVLFLFVCLFICLLLLVCSFLFQMSCNPAFLSRLKEKTPKLFSDFSIFSTTPRKIAKCHLTTLTILGPINSVFRYLITDHRVTVSEVVCGDARKHPSLGSSSGY